MSAESYDKLPYPQLPDIHTHPRIVSAAATALGFSSPVDVEKCRLLELGCATGVNIIAMACELPRSQFIGIDYSKEQIAFGNNIVKELGLKNITLLHLSILDIKPDFGSFDYIIAHGVYSWVPIDVKNKIIKICSDNLSPNGIAYISHNCYPSWHLNMMMRDIMRFHAQHWNSPQEKIKNTLEFAEFISTANPDTPSLYTDIIKQECDALKKHNSSYIYHEYLEEINEPVFFHQFMEIASKQLQYIGDVSFLRQSLDNYPQHISNKIKHYAKTTIEEEQYIDFIYGQKFRRNMLCHKNITLHPDELGNNFKKISLQSRVVNTKIFTEPNGKQSVKYTSNQGTTITLNNPIIITAMQHIISMEPQSIPFILLVKKTLATISKNTSPKLNQVRIDNAIVIKSLTNWLIQAYKNDFVEMSTFTPRIAISINKYPKASSFSRYQARSTATVINLLHRQINLDEYFPQLLTLLDGITSTKDLAQKMIELRPEFFTVNEASLTLKNALEKLLAAALLKA